MKNRIQLSYVLVLLFMSSCSSNSSDSDKLIEITTATDVASCQYQFDEGETAPSTLPNQSLKQTSFGKTYDQHLLYAVGSTSGSETVKFASLTGVDYYRVNLGSSRSCNYTLGLNLAPHGLDQRFSSANKEMKGSVLGIYFDTEKTKLLTNDKTQRPAIIVKNNSDRYTLVHEFMHHLFASKSQNGEVTTAKAMSDKKLLYDIAKKNYAESRKAPEYYEVVLKFNQFVEQMINFSKQYSLEEMTIESELASLYEAGDLKYIHELRRINGDRYILSSANTSYDLLNKIKEELNNLKGEYSISGRSDALVLLNQTKALIDQIEMEVYTLSRRAIIRLQSQQRGYVEIENAKIASDSNEEHDASPCNHSHEEQEFIKNIKF